MIMDNSLSQYIDLYEQQRTTLEANAPEALNAARAAALDTLRRVGRFPRRGDEGYEKISVEDMFAPDFGINISRMKFDADAREEFSCDVPAVGSLSALVVNDTFKADAALEAALPEGVEVMSLAEAAERWPERFADTILPADNAVAALNTLFLQDGVYIHVAEGVHLDRPIQILSIFNTSEPLMAARRIRIDLEADSQAVVMACDHPRVHDVDYLNCRTVEARVGRGASLDFYDLEEATRRTRRASVFASRQEEGARINVCSIFLEGGITRNDFFIAHAGEHCHTRLGGLVVGGGAQIIDNSVSLIHSHPRCQSEQLFKYALFDSAQGAFEGLVQVAEGAAYTDARQSNRNLLASDNARMHAQPQLIINCDEVKASHGSATGQLDENALFYMRSRGIPEEEARMMLVNAFMIDVLDAISLTPLRDRLRHLVERRLRGGDAMCAGCEVAP